MARTRLRTLHSMPMDRPSRAREHATSALLVLAGAAAGVAIGLTIADRVGGIDGLVARVRKRFGGEDDWRGYRGYSARTQHLQSGDEELAPESIAHLHMRGVDAERRSRFRRSAPDADALPRDPRREMRRETRRDATGDARRDGASAVGSDTAARARVARSDHSARRASLDGSVDRETPATVRSGMPMRDAMRSTANVDRRSNAGTALDAAPIDPIVTTDATSGGAVAGASSERRRAVRPNQPDHETLERRVLEAFLNDPILRERAIDICATRDGSIELTGWVQASGEVGHALTLARGVPDVRGVVDRLAVRGPEPTRDHSGQRYEAPAGELDEGPPRAD